MEVWSLGDNIENDGQGSWGSHLILWLGTEKRERQLPLLTQKVEHVWAMTGLYREIGRCGPQGSSAYSTHGHKRGSAPTTCGPEGKSSQRCPRAGTRGCTGRPLCPCSWSHHRWYGRSQWDLESHNDPLRMDTKQWKTHQRMSQHEPMVFPIHLPSLSSQQQRWMHNWEFPHYVL